MADAVNHDPIVAAEKLAQLEKDNPVLHELVVVSAKIIGPVWGRTRRPYTSDKREPKS